MSLSERLRPNVECAQWVFDEVCRLEAERDRLAAAIAALYKMADQNAPPWIIRALCENALPALAAEGENSDV